MKRIISLIIILSIALSAFYGCGNNSSNNTNKDNNNYSESNGSGAEGNSSDGDNEKIDISRFREVKTSYENIDIYRQEIISRNEKLKENEKFITEDEWKVISKSESITDFKVNNNYYFSTLDNNYEITNKYHYPVVFRDGNSLVLWYSNMSGILLFRELYGDGNIGIKKGGEIHCIEGETIILTKTDYKVTYSQETGEVKLWQFGKALDCIEIPSNSIYCGISKYGYIFRSNSEVYSLKEVENYKFDTIVRIAKDVKYVIETDYSFSEYEYSQPLLLMNDGTIKAYIHFDVFESDDPKSLVSLEYEGGYKKDVT